MSYEATYVPDVFVGPKQDCARKVISAVAPAPEDFSTAMAVMMGHLAPYLGGAAIERLDWTSKYKAPVAAADCQLLATIAASAPPTGWEQVLLSQYHQKVAVWLGSQLQGLSYINEIWNEATASSAKAHARWQPPVQSSGDLVAAERRTQRIAAIQSAFGFSVQTLAEVLGISRPQLYKWMDSRRSIALQEESAQRLTWVESLAKQWRARSPAPLSAVASEPLSDGTSIVDRLRERILDVTSIDEGFAELAARLSKKPSSIAARLEARGYKKRTRLALPTDE